MTDRELLELAAKAAGMDVWFSRMADGKRGAIEPCHYRVGNETHEWNPLTDDGDAFRLAVKLKIDVMHNNIHEQQVHAMSDIGVHLVESSAQDPYAATRRAIVRAAAEIGKGQA